MKFSWKIFFTTVIIFVLTFSIGGYILISSLFNSAFEREVNTAREENKMLRFSFQTAASAVRGSNKEIPEDTLKNIMQSIEQGTSSKKLKIRVSDDSFKPIYMSVNLDSKTNVLGNITENMRGYKILKNKGFYFVQTACIVSNGEKQIYLESFHDISSVFKEREEQYDMYRRLLLILVLLNGILILSMSLWITHPIQSLSKAARKIADGNYDDRVKIKARDEIGKLAGDFNIMADNLEKKIHALEDSARRQNDFVGSFAHELKTPLTSIIGYADMLRSRKMSEEKSFIAANYIFEEGKRLESLSLKLLELIVLQKRIFPMKRVNTLLLFEDMKGIMLPILEKEEIIFEIAVEEAWIYVEPDLVKTLFFNLIDNAKKAISGKGKITLTGKCIEDGYSVIVEDTGKGIPSEELPKITEAFYMVDKSRARANGGVGLGLAICMEIVKLHNGEIKFISTPGIGTAISVLLKGEKE